MNASESDDNEETNTRSKEKDLFLSWLKFQCRQPIFEAVILQDGCKMYEKRMKHLSNVDPNSSFAGAVALKITSGIHTVIDAAIKNLKSIDTDMCQQFLDKFPEYRDKFESTINNSIQTQYTKNKNRPSTSGVSSKIKSVHPIELVSPAGSNEEDGFNSTAIPLPLSPSPPPNMELNGKMIPNEQETSEDEVSNISKNMFEIDSGDDQNPDFVTAIEENVNADDIERSVSHEVIDDSPLSPADTVFLNPSVKKSDKISRSDKPKNLMTKDQNTELGSEDIDNLSDTDTVVYLHQNTSEKENTNKCRSNTPNKTHISTNQGNTEDFLESTPGYSGSKDFNGVFTSESHNLEGKDKSNELSSAKQGSSTETHKNPASPVSSSKSKLASRRILNFSNHTDKSKDEDLSDELNSDSGEDIFKTCHKKKQNDNVDPFREQVLNGRGDIDSSENSQDEISTLEGSVDEERSTLDYLERKSKHKKFRKSISCNSDSKTGNTSLEKLKNCPKLKMKTSVYLQTLDFAILAELRKRKVIYLGLTYKKTGKPRSDELDKAIRCLSAYNPIKDGNGTPTNARTKLKKAYTKERGITTAFTSSDENDSDRTVSLGHDGKENRILHKIKEIDQDVPSHEEEESHSELDIEVSEGENTARNAVLGLGSSGKKRKTRSMTKNLLEKTKGVKFLTPNTGPSINTDSDSSSGSSSRRMRRRKKLKYEKMESGTTKKEIKYDDNSDSDFIETRRRMRRKVAEISSDDNKSSHGSVDKSNSDSSDEDFVVRKRLTRHAQKRGVGTSEDEKLNKNPKKKIRRRLNVSSDSDNSDIQILEDDSDIQEILNETGSPNKGRKKIRKVMDEKELNKSTRQAGKEEEDRKKRISERQKLFNEFFEAPESDVVEQLVLDFDSKTKEPILCVDKEIVKKLKPHQCKGIQFMWNACFESVEKKGTGSGCILAHCMGLGKTLQTIAFIHTVYNYKELDIKSVLIICPLNTVGNWHSEFKLWLKNVKNGIRLHKLYEYTGKRRTDAVEDWKRMGGIAIIHYDAFRVLANTVYPPPHKGKGKETKKKTSQRDMKIIEEALLNPGPDIVVCDEGHVLKNAASKLTHAVGKFRTKRRIVLTGTPLQNNLTEYHTMMNFVKPSLLGDKKEFMNRFVNPIANGQHKDSDDADVKLMKRRAHVLHKLLDGCVQRLDYSVLTPFLPPKYEYAISINLSDVQKKMYMHYLKNLSGNTMGEHFQTSKLFADYQTLLKIWTHPKILTFKNRGAPGDKKYNTDSDSVGSLKDFIDDGEDSNCSLNSDDDDDIDVLDANGEKVPKLSKRGANRNRPENTSAAPGVENTAIGPEWYHSFFQSKEDMEKIEISGKLIVLMDILKTCENIGDKILVFSQYLTSLDLIEELLQDIDRESRKFGSSTSDVNATINFPVTLENKVQVGRWRPNIEYFRIDGSTKCGDRQKHCETFNVRTASKAKLFLISTKAGGLGINLVGANRVVIFDASWNPSHDLQSIFRVFRFGQTKPCYVYRLLARGTMEEKIYNRQVVKLSLSCRVIDEQQIERHFHFDEIRQMYQFDPNDMRERPVPIVPKDRLLADLLISLKDWIFSYLEHDSLLENKEEEELTEEERKAAWDEYNNFNESQQHNRAVNSLGEDPWIVKSAGIIRLNNPQLAEWQIQIMAREAKIEVQQLCTEWDAIHSNSISEIAKLGRRAKFDQLFANLSLKFGAMAEFQNILKKYPAPKEPSSYIYSYPKNNPSVRGLGIVSAASVNLNGVGVQSRPGLGNTVGPVINPGSVMTLNSSIENPTPQVYKNRTLGQSNYNERWSNKFQRHNNTTGSTVSTTTASAILNHLKRPVLLPSSSIQESTQVGHAVRVNIDSSAPSHPHIETLENQMDTDSSYFRNFEQPTSIYDSIESSMIQRPKPAVINTRPITYVPPSTKTTRVEPESILVDDENITP